MAYRLLAAVAKVSEGNFMVHTFCRLRITHLNIKLISLWFHTEEVIVAIVDKHRCLTIAHLAGCRSLHLSQYLQEVRQNMVELRRFKGLHLAHPHEFLRVHLDSEIHHLIDFIYQLPVHEG